MPNYYDILGIGADANQVQIKEAYIFKVNVLHPDRMALLSEKIRTKAESELKIINEAYSALSKPEQKKHYDSTLNNEPPRPSKSIGTCAFCRNLVTVDNGVVFHVTGAVGHTECLMCHCVACAQRFKSNDDIVLLGQGYYAHTTCVTSYCYFCSQNIDKDGAYFINDEGGVAHENCLKSQIGHANQQGFTKVNHFIYDGGPSSKTGETKPLPKLKTLDRIMIGVASVIIVWLLIAVVVANLTGGFTE